MIEYNQQLGGYLIKGSTTAQQLRVLPSQVAGLTNDLQRQRNTIQDLMNKLGIALGEIHRLNAEIKDLRKKTGVDIKMPTQQELGLFLEEI